MKTALEEYMDGLKEAGTEFLRGGNDTNIEIIVGNKVRVFNADGSDQNTESSAAMAEMPRYQCHKKVWALKIAKIEQGDDRDTFLTMHFVEKFSPITMDLDWFMKHNPEEGGYYVVYQDGYKSFSPAEAFERGYTLTYGNEIEGRLLLAAAEYFFESGEEGVYMPCDVITHAKETGNANEGAEFELQFAVTGTATFKIVNGHPVMQEMSPMYYTRGERPV